MQEGQRKTERRKEGEKNKRRKGWRKNGKEEKENGKKKEGRGKKGRLIERIRSNKGIVINIISLKHKKADVTRKFVVLNEVT